MVTCAGCGETHPDDRRFCPDCGAALTMSCPSCGAPGMPGKKFCADCGAELAGAAPQQREPEIAAAPVAERRICSVLFCDLVGFTPMSEARDPEEVRELLSRYFEIARTIVDRYGGVVEKFIGDAVMAVWGTPVASEGDGERAVRAALDVVAAVAQLGRETGVSSLAARVGVVTGEVAVTLGATHEGMVAGDAVNTAARVQAAAEPGSVLVDAATQRLAASAISFESAGLRELKGKAAPEELWQALRVLSGVGGAQRVDGLEAPMTGREAELQTVKELLHATIERQVPRLLVVSGPAGVGKSRLGWEFEKYVDGLRRFVLWHRGRCLSYGDGVTFWALAEVVRQRLGIAEEESTSTAATKLATGLADLIPESTERNYVEPRLARLLGVQLTDAAAEALSTDELFAGWRVYFERLAATDPVVILIEDGHRADDGLLDFLDHLIDWTHDLPIFVMVFSRPELAQRRPGFGTGRNRTTLTLDPLDVRSMRDLVEALVPGMTEETQQRIIERAQGVPLFAVETIRALIDRDIVQPFEGVYRLVGQVGDLAVPDSLHALLAARLDALSAPVRSLVADASVLGSTFPPEALIAVSNLGEAAVREGLGELLRREVLEISADPLSPQRGTYRFSQEMLRQVAYETLSRRDRKARHLAVASHLRTTFDNDGEEVMDVIARHYLDAMAAVPDDPDHDAILEQAITALTRAAERAQRTGAPGRAAGLFTQAAELLDVPDADADTSQAAAELWERAVRANDAAADWDGVLASGERAEAIYQRAGKRRDAARVISARGRAYQQLGRHAVARPLLTEALDVLMAEPDADAVNALSHLAALEVFTGSADADRVTTEVLTLCQALAVDLRMLVRAFIGRGLFLQVMGRRLESIAYYREAARLAERVEERRGGGLALSNQSDALAVDDPAGAVEAAMAAIELCRAAGDRVSLGTARANLAYAQISLGQWQAAQTAMTDGIHADGSASGYLMSIVAWLATLRGDLDEIDQLLAELAALRASDDAQDNAALLRVEAFLAVAQRDSAAALSKAQQILQLAPTVGIHAETICWAWPLAARSAHELGDRQVITELLDMLDEYQPGLLAPLQRSERDLVRARLAAADGAAGAGEQFAAAITALRNRSTPYHLAHGLLDQAEFSFGAGDAAAASLAIEESTAIAEKLGCAPLLTRAKRVAASSPAAVRQ